jgi:hypothetical protein
MLDQTEDGSSPTSTRNATTMQSRRERLPVLIRRDWL